MRSPSLVLSLAILLSVACGPKPENVKVFNGIPMVNITKVRFTMGNNMSKSVGERPAHEVEIYPFYMSTTEITNKQYAAFLNEALTNDEIFVDEDTGSLQCVVLGNKKPCKNKHLVHWINSKDPEERPSWLTYKDGTFGTVTGKENLPVIGVTWFGAFTYAAHYRFRLPTEAEWECAARGGKNFPFGNKTGTADVSGEFSNFKNFIGEPVDVGNYSSNPFDLYDMSGNVREWCLDRFENNFYSKSPPKNPFNGSNPEIIVERVVRGGAFNSPSSACQTSAREHMKSDGYDARTGFRVVFSFYEVGFK